MAKYRVVLAESDKKRQDKWWFRVVHQNGNVIATSETYNNKSTRTRIANNLAKEAGWEVTTE